MSDPTPYEQLQAESANVLLSRTTDLDRLKDGIRLVMCGMSGAIKSLKSNVIDTDLLEEFHSQLNDLMK